MLVESTRSEMTGGSWTPKARAAAFLLAGTSIGSLLADFYRICPLKTSTPFLFLPAMAALGVLAQRDRSHGGGQLCRAICIGLISGLVAAIAYDLFRLPFVFAREWGISEVVPPLKLFKVFPRFGAMILGQPIEQPAYSLAANLIGWAYHFSNGATFGVMYLALIGSSLRRHWIWGVGFALVLELGMIATPYPAVFNIPVTRNFIWVTVAAHSIFGVTLGLTTRWIEQAAMGNRRKGP